MKTYIKCCKNIEDVELILHIREDGIVKRMSGKKEGRTNQPVKNR